MTRVGEGMKLLNCVSQDMEALANILASAPRVVSKYRANVPDHLSGHCKMAAGSGLGTRLGEFQGGLDKVLGLRNTSTSIIAFLTFQSRIHMLADCSKAECAYPEPWQGLVLHSRPWYDPYVRSQGATRSIGLNCLIAFTI